MDRRAFLLGALAAVAGCSTTANANPGGVMPTHKASFGRTPTRTVLTPTAGTTPPPAGTWWGWDPTGTAAPPVLPDFPWHDNTGVFDATERAALTDIQGNYTTQANNEVVTGKNISGNLIINHSGVTVKRCVIRGMIKGFGSTITAGTAKIIHCDIGTGVAGDFVQESAISDGAAHFYRCNVFGVCDGIGPVVTSGECIIQDNFIHDLRYARDSNQPSGDTHNDCVQPKGNGGTYTLRHNTFWCWTANNYAPAAETCTRSSGPNWYDTSATTSPSAGYQTSGILLGTNYAQSRLNLYDNLFRGNANQYVVFRGNVSGSSYRGNRFSSVESVYSPLCIFDDPANIATVPMTNLGDNRYHDGDPRAGQLIDY